MVRTVLKTTSQSPLSCCTLKSNEISVLFVRIKREVPVIWFFFVATHRHVYHTDWGSDAAVRRTDLDGSNDVIVANQLDNPNGVFVHGDTGRN